MNISLWANFTFDHFGLGAYMTRVRRYPDGKLGVKVSLYLTFLEVYLVFEFDQYA